MNLIKVKELLVHNHALFLTENTSWSHVNSNHSYGTGLTINHKHCIEYINDEMYINIGKLNKAVSDFYKTNAYDLIFIALSGNYVILFSDKVTKDELPYSSISIDEYYIKNILE